MLLYWLKIYTQYVQMNILINNHNKLTDNDFFFLIPYIFWYFFNINDLNRRIKGESLMVFIWYSFFSIYMNGLCVSAEVLA